ncbi:MAG: hypothetical protein DHS20C18_44040 [Saprospiraceae bacterium]|nr:MAG: hypothetical protein DHS20C18_44040 [Saprospiraceae bacterium]
MSYPYNEETIELLDWILTYLYEREGAMVPDNLAKQLRYKKEQGEYEKYIKEPHMVNDCVDIIVQKGFAKRTPQRMLKIIPTGVHFHNQGGFAADFTRHQAALQKAEKEATIIDRLKVLQVAELEGRLANMEEQMAEQREFWTSATKRNKIQRIQLLVVIFVMVINLCLALYSIFFGQK